MGCMLGPVATEAIQVVSDKISLLTSASTGAVGKAMAAHPGTQDAAARLEVTMACFWLEHLPKKKSVRNVCWIWCLHMSSKWVIHPYFAHISMYFSICPLWKRPHPLCFRRDRTAAVRNAFWRSWSRVWRTSVPRAWFYMRGGPTRLTRRSNPGSFSGYFRILSSCHIMAFRWM